MVLTPARDGMEKHLLHFPDQTLDLRPFCSVQRTERGDRPGVPDRSKRPDRLLPDQPVLVLQRPDQVVDSPGIPQPAEGLSPLPPGGGVGIGQQSTVILVPLVRHPPSLAAGGPGGVEDVLPLDEDESVLFCVTDRIVLLQGQAGLIVQHLADRNGRCHAGHPGQGH